MNRTRIRSAVAILVALGLVLTASPSVADSRTFKDPTGDTRAAGLLDIGRVTVKNTKKYVSVKFAFPANNFVPGPDGYLEVLLDTDAKARGPELSWSAPLFSEFSIVPVRRGKKLFKKEWLRMDGTQTRCGRTVRIDWNPPKGYGRLKLFKKAGCVGSPSRVRVQVRTVVTGERPTYGSPVRYSRPERDFFPSASRYSAWVRR
ncbi:hypothetical protein [Aeromicrobium wangtongii]|uniref:Uncharacterized protein n=1 Tax=Aeromicrobium wangtongii TaxID=2969247 RepID=A0ABY5M3F4_9ACTN|nr:hypothetical protein [Aeromicrobium wangtongii]MCD9198351.1 hypothetical protein [Aeromicrobium wangtongii]UUP12382.1 hypothetical protein NQV15_11005 [Aeromicrobium wangtongii]